MDAKERRQQIIEMLKNAESNGKPVSAASLAKHFGVSRQVIVGDVALLRAAGSDISSTARGYVYREDSDAPAAFGYTGIVACSHGDDLLLEELYCVVDYGGCLIDVMIEHPIYGQLSGTLDIRSRFDADQFAAKVACGEGTPLSALTGGIHLHRIGCRNEEDFLRIRNALSERGILLPG